MRVIGTAGHVDHGKSTLIAALTGINPDRLKEEKEREMTIDLGFAWLTLPDGEEVGIVDVPGHRDFIENMLAGIGGIDLALLVIAADEGVMPQTREHLAIIDLLEIKNGIVVLTKVDLVDEAGWLDLVESDVRTALQGTVLQDAPILRVSSRTRQGFPELLQTLSDQLETVLPRLDLGKPRLPIDRVFSIAGFGTVVTGTLSDGQFNPGEEVEILPSRKRSRIRGLQTHKKKSQKTTPGIRLAVNLSGIDVDQINRGEVLTRPGQYEPTQRLDVKFRLLSDVQSPLHHHTEVKLFIGASETIGDVRLLGVESLNPGESGFLQIELRDPVVAARGDHYILRRPSPGETLGGGRVLDAYPEKRHKRFDGKVLDALARMEKGSPAEVVIQTSLTLGPSLVKELITGSGLEQSSAETGINALIQDGQLIQLEDVVLVSSQWENIKDTILTTTATYHENNPLKQGIPREELKSRLRLQPRFFNIAVHQLASSGSLREESKWISLPQHVVRFSPFEQVKVDKLLNQFDQAPYSPPTVKESKAEVGEDVFTTLVETGELIAVSNEVVFRGRDYQEMEERIRRTLREKGQISLAEVRDLFQTSRKYVQPFLEHLDAVGITIRVGDVRKLKKLD
jgi:selenocysteine-specific elongation factor